jgi:ribosomal protein S12 methylthiotransferase accessory factor
MDMRIYFAGNQKVNAEYKGFTVVTDQPVGAGGEGSAPSPFDLFVFSLGTCAGFFVLRFMQERNIPTSGTTLGLSTERDPQTHLIAKVRIEVQLPPDFPDKYRQAVIRAAETCTVKRHLDNPPAIEVTTSSR